MDISRLFNMPRFYGEVLQADIENLRFVVDLQMMYNQSFDKHACIRSCTRVHYSSRARPRLGKHQLFLFFKFSVRLILYLS